jgi:hypothetical protein
MLHYKKTWLMMLIAPVALISCMEQKILFDFDQDVNRDFFKSVPGLGLKEYAGQSITKMANTADVYVSSFSEKTIEKDHLLEFTELNDSTTNPFITYRAVQGYSQNLYIIKYQFTYSLPNTKTGKPFDVITPAAVFFSVKRNGRGSIIGITPCYYGSINEEDDLIAFDTELSLQKDNKHLYLKPLKKNKNMKGVMFLPADIPESPNSAEDKFNIEKIVRLDPNKVGGYKPLVFDINAIFHDPNALQFHYDHTITLTH